MIEQEAGSVAAEAEHGEGDEDLGWWKDVPDLHWQRDEGRIDQETVSAVLAAVADVSDLLTPTPGGGIAGTAGPLDYVEPPTGHLRLSLIVRSA